jgi:hypothetical protein
VSRLRLRIEGEAGEVTLRAFVDILNRARYILGDLDSAISERPRGSLEWYISDLAVGSAVAVVESRPKVPEADDHLALMVSANFVSGLDIVERGEAIPPYFSDTDMGRVRAIAQRLGKPGAETLEATHLNGGQASATVTEQAAVNVKKLLEPSSSAIGSVAGKLEVISVHGPPRFNVYDLVTKRAVRCRFPSEQLGEVAAALGRKVVVTGIVYRNSNGEPIRVEKPELRVLPDDAELPTTRDLIGLVPDLTGDLSAEEYVRRLRNG